MSFDPYNYLLKIWDSNSQSGSPLGSVWVHSLTLSYPPSSMKCDSHASLLACTFSSLCLGREPKTKVVTDFIIDLPPFSFYDSILVVVDHLMKMVHFISCTKTINGERTSKLFVNHVFWYHGFLENIIFDHQLKFAYKF